MAHTGIMKYTLISILLYMHPFLTADAAERTIDGRPVVEAKVLQTSVVIELYEEQSLPMGEGFSVFIRGWAPDDTIRVSAVGPREEKVNLLTPGTTLPVTHEGKVEFSVTYEHQSLYQGQWILVVEGRSGLHGHHFTVPIRH